MAGKKPVNLTGVMVALAVIAIITVGGITGLALAVWPGSDAKQDGQQQDKQTEILAKAVAKLSAKGILEYEDPMERQFFLDKLAKDIKADFPEIKDIWVLDDKRTVVYSPKENDLTKPYQTPAGIKADGGEKLSVQTLNGNTAWVSMPIISMKTIIGGLRMTVASAPAKTGAVAGNSKSIVMYAGLVAMMLGILIPVIMLSGKAKELANLKPGLTSGTAVSEVKLNSMKAEEASVSAKLENARAQLAIVEQAKGQQKEIEKRLEEMKKQQFEETYKFENLKKESTDLADHIEKRKKILEANPLERQNALTTEEQELASKISTHKQEEVKLAQKIELIRKKVIDLDKRIDARRREEQEISERIEARKKEEKNLSLTKG